MTKIKIIYCKKNHQYQNYQFIKNEKYVLEIHENHIYNILKIFDLNGNNVIITVDNNKNYNITRKNNTFFITESQLRLKKLKKINSL